MSPCSSDCIFQALLRALSGVQSLRILDSYELVPLHLPKSAAPIHGGRRLEKPPEAGGRAVVVESELPNNQRELLEVRLLAREHGVALEERNDAIEQVERACARRKQVLDPADCWA